MPDRKMKKGISILLAVLVTAIIVATGLAVATILIVEFQTSILASDSVTAIYAAESGTECKLFQIRHGSGGPCVAGSGIEETFSLTAVSATYRVRYDIIGATTTVKSVGTFGRARRALETTF